MLKKGIVPILDLVEMFGEDYTREILSDFSCEYAEGMRNDGVEQFLKKSAIDFAKRKMSITYVITDDAFHPRGYFTLTHKPVAIPARALKSKTAQRKMERHAKYDEALDAYNVSAFLIAQFSKNYNIPEDERISGAELMCYALAIIEQVQRMIGGGVVFLECEDNQELIDFYTADPNTFFLFGDRFCVEDDVTYAQLMRFL
ncbi:MAG: GNAT family acetyltransferase [Oscillospiraceae bacterium]|nr:GNAT family acetyltransferase [Oscillospiraceae bacterium]